ncbi:MAG: hypothetical protein EZS28_006162 [Streblomastix strix]|uniref:Uncharacterized protein n=1 Tax=Streblomastix strix TaxID=222440 RepID=A0A5J4WVD9_9EUKA|nr:MAG: hypothetical protein EZS28_006162 [Streblomastix strix]
MARSAAAGRCRNVFCCSSHRTTDLSLLRNRIQACIFSVGLQMALVFFCETAWKITMGPETANHLSKGCGVVHPIKT